MTYAAASAPVINRAPVSRISRYPAFIAGLHWLTALGIFGLFALGLSFDSFPRTIRPWWINLQTIIGLTVFVLVLLRLFWRLRSMPPALPEGTSAVVRLASAITHMLYLLMVVIPVTGIVAYVWHGRMFDFGVFRLDLGIASTKSVYESAEIAHKYVVFILIGLVVLHVLAALWHHFVTRDGMLWRM